MTTCQTGICLLHAAQQEIQTLQRKLERCRDVMECNDPIAARDIFREARASMWKKRSDGDPVCAHCGRTTANRPVEHP